MNDRIRSREVRLVGQDGEQIGIRSLAQALNMAQDSGLDLVEVADNANPPVCRIMDYGKFKYEQSQKAKEARKKATTVSVKEMKYRPKIGVGDFNTKTSKVEKFLGEGSKVKVTIMFRGREQQHPELGRRILDDVADAVAHVGRIEIYPKLDGRNMVMVLVPGQGTRRQREEAVAIETERAAEVAAEEATAMETDEAVLTEETTTEEAVKTEETTAEETTTEETA
ncbi:MAG: translation initiation factor IF-3 [Actinobacteria bacterium]|nr:translation initiation factor IF-3 [Actinomycetota bacterium]MBT3747182.1 translation initiation factor IF-3 [Actinomycetota bacterium]MBT3969979.1 translation initiation factor IF-3 [Actinomycetota bacterium]MBT4008877.1 translation initiation factor IF-3 [Actinomycetota bacterium]MBT4303956.1 translation initiation factor IF-3 [Actinomycetota bacterium]